MMEPPIIACCLVLLMLIGSSTIGGLPDSYLSESEEDDVDTLQVPRRENKPCEKGERKINGICKFVFTNKQIENNKETRNLFWFLKN